MEQEEQELISESVKHSIQVDDMIDEEHGFLTMRQIDQVIGSQRDEQFENKQADPVIENQKVDDLIIEDVQDMYNLDEELALGQEHSLAY